jgi:hypothetical protein
LRAKAAVIIGTRTKFRQTIYGGSIMGAKVLSEKIIWKLEAALKCRSCKKGRYAPPVHMIKLTQEREIASYPWTHPDDDDRR